MTKRERDVKREVIRGCRLLQRATRPKSIQNLPSEAHGVMLLAALMIIEVVVTSIKEAKPL